MKSKENLNILLDQETRSDRVSNDLKILKNAKFKNYEICQYLIISYVKALVKIWISFEHFFMMILRN
jgi:hypothetical protein